MIGHKKEPKKKKGADVEQKQNSAKRKSKGKGGQIGFSSTFQTRAEDPVLKTKGQKGVKNKKITSKSTHKYPSHKMRWERRMGMGEYKVRWHWC